MYFLKKDNWYVERVLFLLAGVFSLVGVLVGSLVSPWGFLLNALVGLNLFVFGTTGFCPMAIVLDRLGFPARCKRDSQ